MSRAFNEKRRQQFLTEPYYKEYDKYLTEEGTHWRDEIQAVAATEEENRMLARADHADFAYMQFSLRYSAGESLDVLRSELTGVVEAYERFQIALASFENESTASPLSLDDLGDYERCVQLLGLCILLHRPDLLARVAALVDPSYEGEDTLYEDLLAGYLPNRVDLDEWYHDEPYSTLVEAMYADDPTEASDKLARYCKTWYPAFKHVPWHDGHLRIDGTEGDYFGYWAFEAAAAAFLKNIDDAGVQHMVYPTDLVVYARKLKGQAESSGPSAFLRLRCEAQQPCPRDGYWFTPAEAGSRRFFKAGTVMPSVGGDYGATIWQWDQNQDPPKL